MSERTWYVSRMKHKTLPLTVKGVIGLKLAADAVPEDKPLIQFLDPLTEGQVDERHGGNRELLESGVGLNRVWIEKSNFVEHMIKEAGEDPDLVHGASIDSGHYRHNRLLAELECPLIVAKDSGNVDGYDRALLDGRPFFVFGGLDCFYNTSVKRYGSDHRLLKNGWSVRGFANAVIDAGDDISESKTLYYVWPTPGRMRAQGNRRKKAAKDGSRKLKERAKTWNLVFKDDDHLNVRKGNVQINRMLDRVGDVSNAEHYADKRAERMVKTYMADVFNLCAWRRLMGKSVGLDVLKRKLISANAHMPDLAFPTDADMRDAIQQLRASKDRWALTEEGKWRFCCARHLKETAKSIKRDRTAADKRRGIVRTRFGIIQIATFWRLVAAVHELPLTDEEWFQSVIAEDVYRKRRKNIGKYKKEVNAFLKKMAERENGEE